MTVQGPVKKQQPDGMSHRGSGKVAPVTVPFLKWHSEDHPCLRDGATQWQEQKQCFKNLPRDVSLKMISASRYVCGGHPCTQTWSHKGCS